MFTDSEQTMLIEMIAREQQVSAQRRFGASCTPVGTSAFYPATPQEKLDIDRALAGLRTKLEALRSSLNSGRQG